MSEENKRPWYKNPWIIGGMIILVWIVGSVSGNHDGNLSNAADEESPDDTTTKIELVEPKESPTKIDVKEETPSPTPKQETTYKAPRSTPKPSPKPANNCDPNYTGCVPIASDVDCGGGSGNGPAYQYGAVQVIGIDIYDLDRDGDGWACE